MTLAATPPRRTRQLSYTPDNMSASTHSDATNADAQDAEAPKIEALFLIKFDKKVGYVMRPY